MQILYRHKTYLRSRCLKLLSLNQVFFIVKSIVLVMSHGIIRNSLFLSVTKLIVHFFRSLADDRSPILSLAIRYKQNIMKQMSRSLTHLSIVVKCKNVKMVSLSSETKQNKKCLSFLMYYKKKCTPTFLLLLLKANRKK
jgi:hypothetical protein